MGASEDLSITTPRTVRSCASRLASCARAAEAHVVLARAIVGVNGLGLVGETLGTHYHLILGALGHTDCELAARVGTVFPAELLLAGTANAKLRTGEGNSMVGENCSADQKIVGVAISLRIFRRRRRGRRRRLR